MMFCKTTHFELIITCVEESSAALNLRLEPSGVRHEKLAVWRLQKSRSNNCRRRPAAHRAHCISNENQADVFRLRKLTSAKRRKQLTATCSKMFCTNARNSILSMAITQSPFGDKSVGQSTRGYDTHPCFHSSVPLFAGLLEDGKMHR